MMDVTMSSPISVGMKRAAVAVEDNTNSKRVRYAQDLGSSDNSDNDSSDQESDEGDTVTTPLSSLSTKTSPRIRPCRINHLPCTYPDCTKTFNRPARLEEHLRSHTNTRPFTCPYPPCTKDFLRDTHLKRHIQSAHTNERGYVCKYEECGRSFSTGTRLKRHYAAHEGRDRYKCDKAGCGQSFRKHGTLQRHKLTEHEGKDAFTCEVIEEDGTMCGKGFGNAYKLKLHQGRYHHTQRYWCTVCKEPSGDNGEMMDLPFSTYSDLQAHNKDVHPPVCQDCGLKCLSSRGLNQHMEIVHSGQNLNDRRKFPCTEPGCNRSFVKQSNVAVHVRSVHEKLKPFVCNNIDPTTLNNVHGWDGSDACQRSYAMKAGLEEHIRTAHLGLDHSRKARDKKLGIYKNKSVTRAPSGTTTLGLLTGTAYAEDPTRNIPCRVNGCEFMFTRIYDLSSHLQSIHGAGEEEIQSLQATQPTATNYLGPGDEMDISIEGGLNSVMEGANEKQTTFNDDQDWALSIENSAASGGPFWIGGDDGDLGGYDGTDPWNIEEADMRRLTCEDEDMGVIDPDLH